MSTDELRTVFRSADKDLDGVLRFSDFEEFMRNSALATQLSLPKPKAITARVPRAVQLPTWDSPADPHKLPDLSWWDATSLPYVRWSSEVPVPEIYWSRGTKIPETELRGITLEQITNLASLVRQVVTKVSIPDPFTSLARVTWLIVNMYHIDPNFVQPLTKPFKCSFVELVASASQPPRWFVSHFWGTPFAETVSLLRFHSMQRRLPLASPYWICTFANNQHDLSELGSSLTETPFVKAIMSTECQGTLTLMDRNATTLERVWCILENFVSANMATDKGSLEPHRIDIAAWLAYGSGTFGGQQVPAKATLSMDLGHGQMQEVIDDESTGGAFPLAVSVKGSNIDVFKAKSSRPEDRKRILHLIAGTPEESWDLAPPDECQAYDDMNKHLCGMFATGAYYAAALRNDVKEVERLMTMHRSAVDKGLSDGATPLYAAAWKNSMDALKTLLRAMANPNSTKKDGATPLFIAAQAGHHEVISELLQARADVKMAGANGVMPIFKAVCSGSVASAETLLKAKAKPDALHKGWTPLVLAADLGYCDLAKVLVLYKADPNHCASGDSPLGVAKKRAHHDVQQVLREAGATKDCTTLKSKSRNKSGTNIAFAHEFADHGLDLTNIRTDVGGIYGAM